MLRRLFWLVIALALLVGCKTPRVAGECPENATLRCLSRKICETDKRRGCLKCSCETGFTSDPYKAADEAEGTGSP
jgi:hypothetical protein